MALGIFLGVLSTLVLLLLLFVGVLVAREIQRTRMELQNQAARAALISLFVGLAYGAFVARTMMLKSAPTKLFVSNKGRGAGGTGSKHI